LSLRKRNPVSPGQRHALLPDYDEVTRQRPDRRLVRGMRRTGGRNNAGKITARFRGGGHKRRYRQIDFHGRVGMTGRVVSIEYDPNRSARIALLQYPDGVRTYVIAPSGVKPGDTIACGSDAEPKPGNRLPLRNIPEGTGIFNLELVPGRGGCMVRAAGTLATLMVKGDRFGQVRLPSGEVRLIPLDAMATVGQASNPEHKYEVSGKAGRVRWKGRKPHVRGTAMNPVDHPMGGGEGRGKGHQAQSPSGVPAKGYKTRNRKKWTGRLILQRRGRQ